IRTGTRTEGLFGVKAGRRFNKVGVFGKFRPGFFTTGRTTTSFFTEGGSLSQFNTFFNTTNLALDLGGVMEVYHSSRIFTRFDLGDTIIRIGNDLAYDNSGFLRRTTTYNHNLQLSAGVGFRF